MDEREGEKKTDRGKPLHTEIQRVQRNTETDRDIQSYIHVHTEIHTEIHRDTHRDTERDENRKAQSNPFFFSLSPSLPLSLSLSLSLCPSERRTDFGSLFFRAAVRIFGSPSFASMCSEDDIFPLSLSVFVWKRKMGIHRSAPLSCALSLSFSLFLCLLSRYIRSTCVCSCACAKRSERNGGQQKPSPT